MEGGSFDLNNMLRRSEPGKAPRWASYVKWYPSQGGPTFCQSFFAFVRMALLMHGTDISLGFPCGKLGSCLFRLSAESDLSV
jgi:hypothetical protein